MSNALSERPPLIDEAQQRGQMVIRALPIFLLPTVLPVIVGLIIRFVFVEAPNRTPPPLGMPILVSLSSLIIFCIALLLVQIGRPTMSAFFLVGVWTLITTLTVFDNSVSSFGPALLLIPICAAGLLLDGTACVVMAILSTLLIVSSAWLESHGLINFPRSGPFRGPGPIFSAIYWTTIIWSIAVLTSLLAGGLKRALAQSRSQAQALQELSAHLEERVAAQTAELAKRAARAEGLHEIGHALTRTLDIDAVLALISEHAARLLRFESSLVLLQEPDSGGFVLVHAYQLPKWAVELETFQASDTQELQRILHQRQPQTTRLWFIEQRVPVLVLPMLYGDDVAGTLILLSTSGSAEREQDDLVLAQGLADHAAVAIANAQLLAQSHERATLEERTRLARDIHDTLAQGLTGIVVQLSAAQHALSEVPDEADQYLDLAQRLARESLAEARRSVWNLRSPSLERGDLADALRTLVSRPLRPDTSITFEQAGDAWTLPPDVESALLRVGQEALVNIAKHAHASTALVRLSYLPDAVHLKICDNGVGFDEQELHQRAASAEPWGGFGILGMSERLAALGGKLELINDRGAIVSAWVPRQRLATPERITTSQQIYEKV